MKPKSVYLNYNQKTREHYYTIYLSDNTKVYVPYSWIEKAKDYYDKELKKDNTKKD